MNENYHNVKEQVVWFAGVVYLTFSVALMAWYFRCRDKISLPPGLEKWHAAAFLSVIFVLTAAFIFRQTWHKVRSTVKTSKFFELMRDLPNRRTHADLMNANEYNFDKKRNPTWDFISMGWSGHLIFGVVYSFFLAQMAALYGICSWWNTQAGHRVLPFVLAPYILPLAAILLPLLTFLCCKSKKKS